MENNKYFIPDISEMYVGCEFEMDDTWGGWRKLVLTEDLYKHPMVSLGSGNERSPWYHKFRVAYLTVEQIESEGWEHVGGKLISGADQIFNKGNYMLSYSIDSKGICFLVKDPSLVKNYYMEPSFRGWCKDVNEFRKIQKLLKI